MNHICKKKPAFASDFSGAYSVCYEMGGIVITHDPGGCLGHCLMVDDIRFDTDCRPCYTVALREYDTVVGSDEKVVEKVVNALETCDASFAMLIGTPVTMVVGADLPAIARVIEKRTGKSAIGIQTDCIHTYEIGQSKAYLALFNRFAQKNIGDIRECRINVIGATHLDMWDATALDDLEDLLHEIGFDEVVIWGFCSPKDIEQAGKACVNLVVSVSGLEAARRMKQDYGTPYVIGFPVGELQIAPFVAQLCGKKFPQPAANNANISAVPGFGRALIIGEQVQGISYRNCLKNQYGFKQVDVVSFFTMDSELKEGNDAQLYLEEDLQAYIAEHGPYDIFFGDILISDVLPYMPEYYVSTPHMAISSSLGCTNASNCFGIKGTEYFEELWKTIRKMKEN